MHLENRRLDFTTVQYAVGHLTLFTFCHTGKICIGRARDPKTLTECLVLMEFEIVLSVFLDLKSNLADLKCRPNSGGFKTIHMKNKFLNLNNVESEFFPFFG